MTDWVVDRVVDRMRELMLAKDMAGVAALWAPDGVAEFPFAEAGAPRRVAGRAGVGEYLAGYPEVFDVTGFSPARVHHIEPAEPGSASAVVEFASFGRTVATGEPYRMDYVAVVTVRDGLITHYRDYWSPVQVARARGALPQLAAALDGTGSDAGAGVVR